jgi:hypothetical protein
MMKKLLIFMLVLGMASLASAMTLNISVGGVIDPPESTIVLIQSQTIMLDIHSSGFVPGEDVYIGLVADIAQGTMAGGVCEIPPAPDLSSVIGKFSELGWMPLGETMDGIYGGIFSMNAAGAGLYFDEITFHCEAPGDAVVKLFTSPDNEVWTLVDAVIIHQLIPEPATIALLGLGGLLLRRRK